jgi:hypothetical protein
MPKATRKSTTKPFEPPRLPPKSPEEVLQSRKLSAMMEDLARDLRQQTSTERCCWPNRRPAGREWHLVDASGPLAPMAGRRRSGQLKPGDYMWPNEALRDIRDFLATRPA